MEISAVALTFETREKQYLLLPFLFKTPEEIIAAFTQTWVKIT